MQAPGAEQKRDSDPRAEERHRDRQNPRKENQQRSQNHQKQTCGRHHFGFGRAQHAARGDGRADGGPEADTSPHPTTECRRKARVFLHITTMRRRRGRLRPGLSWAAEAAAPPPRRYRAHAVRPCHGSLSALVTSSRCIDEPVQICRGLRSRPLKQPGGDP